MGHGHSHAPAPGHAAGRHRWRLAAAFGLTAVFFVVELVAGLVSGSLALISDAGHMAADVVALGASLAATRIATRADRSGRRTYGSYRAEVFAAGLTVLLMTGAATYVLLEAVQRAGDTPEVASGAMLVVGGLGLVVNVVAVVLLRGGSRESITVRGAYTEVVADAVGSLGVMLAGLLVLLTGRPLWDVVVAVAIAVFVVVRAVVLGRQVLAVLGQHAPQGTDPGAVAAALESIDGVEEVHDLHLWSLTSGMDVATAHLVSVAGSDAPAVLQAARDVLRERFGIAHATVQVERAGDEGCADLAW